MVKSSKRIMESDSSSSSDDDSRSTSPVRVSKNEPRKKSKASASKKRRMESAEKASEGFSDLTMPETSKLAAKYKTSKMNVEMPSINDVQSNENKYDACDITHVNNWEIIKEELCSEELKNDYTSFMKMSLLGNLPAMLELSLSIPYIKDAVLLASSIATYYMSEYSDLCEKYPDIEEWIQVVCHLACHDMLDTVKKNTTIKTMKVAAIKLFSLGAPKPEQTKIECTHYIQSLPFFREHPILLNLGQFGKKLLPACFLVFAMTPSVQNISKFEAGEVKRTYSGVNVSFEKPILWRIEPDVTDKYVWFRIARVDMLQTVLEKLTGRRSITSSFTVGRKRNEQQSWIINQRTVDDKQFESCRYPKPGSKTSVENMDTFFGVNSAAGFLGSGAEFINGKFFMDASYIFHDRSNVAKHLADSVSLVTPSINSNKSENVKKILEFYKSHNAEAYSAVNECFNQTEDESVD